MRGLNKSFGAKQAVAGVDLSIAAGSLAGLVGPNGAGKTTSLSMMTGLLRPDMGRVLIDSLDLRADPAAAKAVIKVVPAEMQLFDRLSGEELPEYAGRRGGAAVARLLVRLKLRLPLNALRSSTQAKVSCVLSTVFAGLVALGTFAAAP